jgi:quinol monooxygenase YgiN
MTAFNAVRFTIKPGRNQDFLDAHERVERDWPGLRHVNIIQTGEQGYCIIGEWDDMAAMAAARPHMLATLDTFRDTLDGDTDPVSGPVVLALK